jgi:hypothetical protein
MATALGSRGVTPSTAKVLFICEFVKYGLQRSEEALD